MPWSEVSKVDQRRRFIVDAQLGAFSLSELCRRYDVSRPTGYLWLDRFTDGGVAALADRSHAPHSCPHATPAHVWEAVRQARHEHPLWGPKKLLWLVAKRLDDALPAPSTVAAWLKRHGLVAARRRRPQRPHPGKPVGHATAPNVLWTLDFKGHFRTRDGIYCYPLTAVDAYSRFVLEVRALLHPTHTLTRSALVELFHAYGLPERIRTDNGEPFAGMALARLSRLAAWFIRLGITPELIEPGHPEQNPRHERMHRDLKAETTRPPAHNYRGQQQRFRVWRREYNELRPHEAHQQQPPVTLYQPSPRPYRARPQPPEYPGHYEVRRVSRNGGIRWQSKRIPVSQTLIEEYIGFEAIDDGLWDVYYYHCRLGRFDERRGRIIDDRGRAFRHSPRV